mgnify:CR=1 FL=1
MYVAWTTTAQRADADRLAREAIEARLAATQAHLEANEARYRLLLDAHQLWPIADAEASAGH